MSGENGGPLQCKISCNSLTCTSKPLVFAAYCRDKLWQAAINLQVGARWAPDEMIRAGR